MQSQSKATFFFRRTQNGTRIYEFTKCYFH
jgi:hypothetical protein